jgi:hypothetical protein
LFSKKSTIEYTVLGQKHSFKVTLDFSKPDNRLPEANPDEVAQILRTINLP